MITDKIYNILVINPGSTSTKVSVFENGDERFSHTIRHTRAELDAAGKIPEQKDMRMNCVLEALEESGLSLNKLDAVVGRGGLIDPIDSGTYAINDRMLRDLISTAAATHASSLGGVIARAVADRADIPCYVVDPVVVDEVEPVARLTGLPGLERRIVFHALNQKAVARRCAADMGMQYEDGRFIVAHMGGGITVGAHRYGRVVDVNDGLNGEGPFTPERTGGLPVLALIDLCFSGAYDREELTDIVTQAGGMYAYLGTNDLMRCERMIKEGDEYAVLVLESMAYQVSKEIGAMFVALEGRVDAIILTGGLAHSTRFTGCIKQHCGLIAPVKLYPGEDEMRALAEGALRVLRGEEKAVDY